MGFAAPEETSGPIAATNVVPLVDIMLVLLVIFMITAPMMQQGVEVNLPRASTAAIAGQNEQIVVSIDAAGKVYIGSGNETTADTIGPKLAAIMESRNPEDRKVYIKADQSVAYGVIMQVMGKIHSSGIYSIGLISQPEAAGSK